MWWASWCRTWAVRSWLGLPSQHGSGPWWSYAKRPLAEILCDVFAAELLLPYDLFHPEAEKASIGISSIDDLADRFPASVTATGSRYAAVVSSPVDLCLANRAKCGTHQNQRHLRMHRPGFRLASTSRKVLSRRRCARASPPRVKTRSTPTFGSVSGSEVEPWWRKCDTWLSGIRHYRCFGSRIWRFRGVRSETNMAGFMRKKPKRMRYCRNRMANCDGQESSDDASSGFRPTVVSS